MGLTFFDFFIFGVIGFFTLLGFIRGFIREIFSIITWVTASLFTIYLSPMISEIILKKIPIPLIANIISNSFVFTLFLIGTSILATNLARGIGNKIPTSINLSLGIAFGFAKGYLLSALIFSGIFLLYDGKDYSTRVGPGWFSKSQSYRPLSLGCYIVDPFSKILFSSFGKEDSSNFDDNSVIKNDDENYLDKIIDTENLNNIENESTSKIRRAKQLRKKIDSIKDEVPSSQQGYDKEQINKMDRLIDSIQ